MRQARGVAASPVLRDNLEVAMHVIAAAMTGGYTTATLPVSSTFQPLKPPR